jgi:hypothetical protein
MQGAVRLTVKAACVHVALLCSLAIGTPAPAAAQINVTTNRYDQARTGANLSESRLTPATVDAGRFGKIGSYPVDGGIYAQPLYVSGVLINGVRRNVLYVATMNDKVYAFDADGASSSPLWMRDFTKPPAVTPVPITDIVPGDLNVVGNVGIQSTPVIDAGSKTLFLVARTKENGKYFQRLHALDIATGASRGGSPVTITGSVPGNALDATSGPGGKTIAFDPKVHIQRSGLALTNGVVLIAWAAHEDVTPSHGWIMGFDAASLQRVGILAISPDGYLGGIWQGGRAPAIDAQGNAYFATGNGPWDGTRNFGDSVLKLTVSRSGLAIADYFTPANESALDQADWDLSGSGFTLLPGTNLLLGGGKEGVLYLLDSTRLGHQHAGDTQIPQKLPVQGGHVMGGAVFWKSSSEGSLVYNWSEDDVLKAYRLSGGKLTTTPVMKGTALSPGHPGGSLTISANGSAAGTGILWASIPTNRDALHGLVPGMLRAFDAETLDEIWNSEQNAGRDRVGTLVKFVAPLIVNGRVYLPNYDNAVAVYGALPAADFGVAVTPASASVPPGGRATFSIAVDVQGGFAGAVGLRASGAPSGTTAAISPTSVTGPGTATLTVTVPANAVPGSFALTVTGTSGARSHAAPPVTVAVTSASTAAGAIAVNFVGSAGAPMAATESAGALPQTHWNNASGASRATPLALVNATGAASGATATWSAYDTYSTPITEQAGNTRMMKGYLDTSSTSTTSVAIAGLAAGSYDVYVYVDGANSYARSGTYTIAAATNVTATIVDAANANFNGSYTAGNNGTGNYLKFRVTATQFTLKATPRSPTTGTRRAPINGLQIVPVSMRPIGIDFVGDNPKAMASSETAGVVSQAHWNGATAATRSTGLALVDADGRATTATVTWSANGTWATPITDAAGNARLMRGYLDTTSTSTTTVTVNGLAAQNYDVYVYADGANRGYTRTAAYTLTVAGRSPVTIKLTDTANRNYAGTYTQAQNSSGNYVRFRINGGQFTLTATPVSGSNATLRAPVNAIQIVPVP